MTLTKTLFVIGCLFAAAVAWNLLPTATHAGAEPPKGRQKWEYATLAEVSAPAFPPAQASYRLAWRTGKKGLIMESQTRQEGISKLYKDLAGHDLGKDEKAPFGALLDRIGQDGWELVTLFRGGTPGQGGDTQTWTFKRPVP